jgi:hypothetical protein
MRVCVGVPPRACAPHRGAGRRVYETHTERAGAGGSSSLGRVRAPTTLRASARRRPTRLFAYDDGDEPVDAVAVVERASKILDEIVKEFSDTVRRRVPVEQCVANPSGRERMATPTLQTRQEPILQLP